MLLGMALEEVCRRRTLWACRKDIPWVLPEISGFVDMYFGGESHTPPKKTKTMEEIIVKYVCNACGWVYDEEETGVKWEDLPEDFACELCGVGKDEFSPEE